MKYVITLVLALLHFLVCALSGAIGWNNQILIVSLFSGLVVATGSRKFKLPLKFVVISVLPFFVIYTFFSIYEHSYQTFTIWIWGIISTLLFILHFHTKRSFLVSLATVVLIPLFGYFFIWPNHFAYLNTDPLPESYKPFSTKITDLNNVPIDSSKFKGKVVLIDIWHSSCGLCFKQFREIQRLSDQYKDDTTIKIITINYPLSKDSGVKSTKFIGQYNFPKYYFESVDSVSSHIADYVPKTLILDKNLKCRYAGALNTDRNILISNAHRFIEILKYE